MARPFSRRPAGGVTCLCKHPSHRTDRCTGRDKEIVKWGFVGIQQRWKCKVCKHTFVYGDGRSNPQKRRKLTALNDLGEGRNPGKAASLY